VTSEGPERQWVLLCECDNLAEVQMLRATLEAHGCPCQVRGEHTYGVLGPAHGAVVRPRILVPRGALAVARELAEDIVGPFDVAPSADDAPPGSPYRDEAPVATANEASDPSAPATKSYGILILSMFLLVPPLFAATHLYAGRRRTAWALALLSLIAIASLSWKMLAVVWVLDLVGGTRAIRTHNHETLALLEARAAEEEDDDHDDHDDHDGDDNDNDNDNDDPLGGPAPDEAAFWKLLRRLRTGSGDRG